MLIKVKQADFNTLMEATETTLKVFFQRVFLFCVEFMRIVVQDSDLVSSD
jgi:hypothetical protein